MPSGLDTAAFLVTKFCHPLLRKWRGSGILSYMHIDDGFCSVVGNPEASEAVQIVQNDLKKVGFIIADEKCEWEPKTVITWVGHIIDTEKFKLFIPEKKLIKCEKLLSDIYSKIDIFISIKMIAKLVGLLISFRLCIGRLVQFKTRHLNRLIAVAETWSSKIKLSDHISAVSEIDFWITNLRVLNGMFIRPSDTIYPCKYEVASDAATVGFAAAKLHFKVFGGKDLIQGAWSPFEVTLSSTWKEIMAIYRALCIWFIQFKGHRIKWFTDSQNTERAILLGSMTENIHVVAENILELCNKYDIHLEVQWLNREHNIMKAIDFYSREIDLDDWYVSQEDFDNVNLLFGNFTIDIFASILSCRLPRYNSRFFLMDKAKGLMLLRKIGHMRIIGCCLLLN